MQDDHQHNQIPGLPHPLLKLVEQHLPKRVPIAIKLALAITILIVSGMSMLGLTILENQKSIMSKQVLDMGTTVAKQLASSSKEMVLAEDTLGLQTLLNNLIDKSNILGAVILSDTGETLATKGVLPDQATLTDNIKNTLIPGQIDQFEWQSLQEENIYHDVITVLSPIHFQNLLAGHVMVSFTKNDMHQSLEESRHVIVLVTVVMTIIAIFLAFIMSTHLSKPIHSLVNASKAIGEGNYSLRLNERRNDEIGELAQSFNQMADGLLKKSQVENVFSRYVSSNVAKKIMENLEEVELGGKHVNASVLFADIVGFTSISETLPPNEIASLLNEYFSYISRISAFYSGHIDKFMGDCAMVVFGVPEFDKDHSYHAIACAVMIQQLVEKLNELRVRDDKIPVTFRIGINTGNMVAGNLGSHERMEYTVIGDPVNLASRLSSVADSNQIVIMDELYQLEGIKDRIVAHEYQTIRVRGKQKPVSTFLVEDLNEDYRDFMDLQIEVILQEYTAK